MDEQQKQLQSFGFMSKYEDPSMINTTMSSERFKLKNSLQITPKKLQFLSTQTQSLEPLKTLRQTTEKSVLQLDYIQTKIERQKYNKNQIKNDINALEGLQNEREMHIWDKQNIEHNSQTSDKELYKYYKNIDKVVQQNQVMQNNKRDVKSYEQQIVSPQIRFDQAKGSNLKIRTKKLGDRYMDALFSGVKCVPEIDQVNLSNNRISQNGIQNIVPNLSKTIKTLDMSNNVIGKKGCELIYQFISSQCQLQELNIFNNGLGDKSIQILLDGVINNKTITILDLSKNFITNASVDKICEVFQKPQIKELYIHWNQIKAQGAIQIFKELCENKFLKVLDISWNSMGNGKQSSAGQFCEFLKQNKTIVHLDVSNNNYTYQESQEIQKVLNLQNKSIFGLHFFGNYGYIDNNGFLVLDQNQHTKGEQLKINRIRGVESVNIKKQKDKAIVSDVCWICEGWQEAKFQWIPGVSGDSNVRPIYIHLEYEDFKTRYMGKMDSKYQFNHKRMIPFQNQTKYYFTVENKQIHSKNEEIQSENKIKKHYIRIFEDKIQVSIKQMNKFTGNNNSLTSCIDQDYEPQFSILPRTRVLQYRRPNTISVKKWSIPISVFKDWKTDTDDLLKKCFEFDWNSNKLQKFIKKEDELDKIKTLLRNVYPQYKECYKHYASLQPLGDIWALQNLTYFELVNKCHIMDGGIQEADINLKWTSTVSGNQKGNFRMPERGMIRCQLMEAIVRIAEEKYLKSGICPDLVQATEKILNDNFNIEFQKYHSQKWRNKIYWTEQCDDCLKYYRIILENIFKQFSIKKVKPGQKSFMCLDELNEIMKILNLYEENFVERDTCIAYNLSMMTQVDEIQQNRIFEMSYIEFLEASARISEKKCLLPYGATEDLSYNQRQMLPLHIKLEALCVQYLKICDQFVQSTFKLQQKSIFTVAEKKNETDSD